MTSTIDKLFNYIIKLHKYQEEADNNPELEPELKIKWQQAMDELKAKKQEHSDAVEREILQLKAAGKDINPYDQNQNFSLLHFVVAGLLDITLLQHFAITDMKDPSDFLATAIYSKNIEAVEWLLDKGISPNTKNEDGDTMLHLAVWNDKSGEIVNLLIDRGADINAQNDDGYTALQATFPKHNIAIMELLLEKGADANIRDKYNGTVLDKIFGNYYDINNNEIIIPDDVKLKTLRLLLKHGAEITTSPINRVLYQKFQHEETKTCALLLMLGSSQTITIDLASYSARQFFTDSNNVKALFTVDGYEEQKAIAKQNILKSLQDYGQNHHDQKVLDIVQLFTEQEVGIPNTEVAEDTTLPDQLGHQIELSGDFATDMVSAAQKYMEAYKLNSNDNYKAAALNAVGMAFLHNKQFDEARSLFKKAIDIAIDNDLKMIYQDNIAVSLKEQALELRSQDDYDNALIFIDKAIDATTNTSLLPGLTQDKAEILYKQGQWFRSQGKLDDAVGSYEKALSCNKDSGLKNDANEEIAELYNGKAYAYHQEGHYDKAKEFYGKAYELAVNESTKYSIWKNKMATLFWHELQEQFLKLCRKLLVELAKPLAQELGEYVREWFKSFDWSSKSQCNNVNKTHDSEVLEITGDFPDLEESL